MIQIVYNVFRVYELIILARVILSWVNVGPGNPIVIWIYRLTEPLLAPIRQILPTARIGLDLSPLVLILLLELLKRLLLQFLLSMY